MADRPLRVAVMARSAYPIHGLGGLERHVFDLVRHHLADGMRVTLVTRPPAKRTLDAREQDAWGRVEAHPAFTFVPVPYVSFPLAGRRGTTAIDRSTAYPVFGRRVGALVARLAAAGSIDVAYGLGASALGLAQARRRGAGRRVPFVFNPQGLEEFGGPDGRYGGSRLKGLAYAPLRAAVRACAREADAVIATDRALAPTITRHLGARGDRLRLLPNGIDVVMCDALAGPSDGMRVRTAAGLAPSEVVLVSAGRLERNKGFHDLAAALGRWRPAVPWHWVIAGDGPYRTEIRRALAAAGITGRTLLVGRVDDETLHAWYEAADLFAHPTLYEGSSLVTLEAMAHRKPVLATRAGGLPDKVGSRNGWLVAPGDTAALTAALDTALANRDAWPVLGARSRAIVEESFDWRAIQRQFRALYSSLIERAGASTTD